MVVMAPGKALLYSPWQLYDMATDRSEMKDLSAQYPETVKKMAAMWNDWAHKNQVYPMPWKEVQPEQRSYYMSTPWEHPGF